MMAVAVVALGRVGGPSRGKLKARKHEARQKTIEAQLDELCTSFNAWDQTVRELHRVTAACPINFYENTAGHATDTRQKNKEWTKLEGFSMETT